MVDSEKVHFGGAEFTAHTEAERVGEKGKRMHVSEEKMVGVAQAARMIGCSYGNLRTLLRRGKARGTQDNRGEWLLTEAEVRRLAAANAVQPIAWSCPDF